MLPDNAFKDERVDYIYDSAGRTRSVKYSDGTINKDLFTATGGTDIDVFGRVRQAKYGLATYTADYADTGRRLLNSVRVASPAPLTTSRQIAFPAIRGLLPPRRPSILSAASGYVGKPRTASPARLRLSEYDALGQLIASAQLDESTLATHDASQFQLRQPGQCAHTV